ncbi:MAG: FMN-binding protein [Treponema sp.]|jgi:urocanate reductase|nr:FMN-binding protein [Treponema sp.]
MRTFLLIYAVALTTCASVDSGSRCSEGVGQGFRGPIRVAVYTGENGIAFIEILAHDEDEFVGEPAMQALADAVQAANSTDVDAVSGATASSRGFLDAVNGALEKFK